MANSPLYGSASQVFSEGQFLVGDSAYSAQKWLIPPFKKTTTAQMERFNRQLSRMRIGVEHAIGILKARWQI
jgi:hypothetical protein